MSEKLSCNIVRDLLPLYADHLLSSETEEAVKAHLSECEECSRIYEQMTDSEPLPQAEETEIDYLKKIRKGRMRLFGIIGLTVCLLAVSLFGWYRNRPGQAVISYDETSETISVYGGDDFSKLKLPETIDQAKNLDVQSERFHLSVYLPLLRNEEIPLSAYLPAYLERTDQSIQFLREYFRQNCPQSYISEQADKYVDFNISFAGSYSWANREDRIVIEIGDFYWHREELYVLALMDAQIVQWKQLGYAWYVGTCIDPYNEVIPLGFTEPESMQYYDAYIKGGGSEELTPENIRILHDAISYTCLKDGMYWGSAYESMPLSRTALYHVPKLADKTGDDMSVIMAASFVAWLCDQYGFEKTSAFCFSQESFEEAFGRDFRTEYETWSSRIIDTYS